jgi:hypothetical protein
VAMEGIARRIGPSPPEYGSFAVGAVGLEAHLSGRWLSIGRLCLDWQPQRRATADVLASHSAWDTGTVPDTAAVVLPVRCKPSPVSARSAASSAAAGSVASTAIEPDTGHYPTMTDRPFDLGPAEAEVVQSLLDRSSTPCACSGNCGTSGHRRNGCKAVATAASKFCGQCMCKWLTCARPSIWGVIATTIPT